MTFKFEAQDMHILLQIIEHRHIKGKCKTKMQTDGIEVTIKFKIFIKLDAFLYQCIIS